VLFKGTLDLDLQKERKSVRDLLKRKIVNMLLLDKLALVKKPALRSVFPFLPLPSSTGFPV